MVDSTRKSAAYVRNGCGLALKSEFWSSKNPSQNANAKKAAAIAAAERRPAIPTWDHSFSELAEIASEVASVPVRQIVCYNSPTAQSSATRMIRALFVALLLVCCSVCAATGAISLPVTHHPSYTRCTDGARVAQPLPPRARSAGGTAHATRASACTGLHGLGRCAALVCSNTSNHARTAP